MANCSERERKFLITCKKNVNKPLMNAPQKMRLIITKKYIIVKEEELIMNGKSGNIQDKI